MPECILWVLCSTGKALECGVDGMEPVLQERFKGNLIATKPEREKAPVASIREFCRVFEMRRRDLFPTVEARQKQSTSSVSARVDRGGGETSIEGLRSELSQSPAYAQAIACQVLQWIYPDLDEEMVLAMARQIPLKREEQEQRRLRRVIEASALSRDGAEDLPAENVVLLFRERGAGGA